VEHLAAEVQGLHVSRLSPGEGETDVKEQVRTVDKMIFSLRTLLTIYRVGQKSTPDNLLTNHVRWANYISSSCKFPTVYVYVPKIMKIGWQ